VVCCIWFVYGLLTRPLTCSSGFSVGDIWRRITEHFDTHTLDLVVLEGVSFFFTKGLAFAGTAFTYLRKYLVFEGRSLGVCCRCVGRWGHTVWLLRDDLVGCALSFFPLASSSLLLLLHT